MIFISSSKQNSRFRLEKTTIEIETASADTIANGICSTPLTRFPSRKTFSARNEPLGTAEDHLIRLKQEFNRCLDDLKSKRQEILSLKQQISSQTNEIERLKMDENRNLIELTTCRERIDRLESKLKFAENELRRNSGKYNTDDELAISNQQMLELEHKLEEAQRTNQHLQDKLNEIENENGNYRELVDQLNELKLKYNQLKNYKDQRPSSSDELQKEISNLKNSLANVQHAKQLTEVKCEELSKALVRTKEDMQAMSRTGKAIDCY